MEPRKQLGPVYGIRIAALTHRTDVDKTQGTVVALVSEAFGVRNLPAA
jgi:predicted SpoU family rRNA methylase